MIRLVTQFDSPRTRVAAVTPTCSGACCCCCSCIATLIGGSIYTPWNVQQISRRSEREHPERIRWRRPWPAVLAALAVPILLVALVFAWWTAIFPPLVWFLVAGVAYRAAGHGTPWRRAAAIAAIGTLLFVVEFVVWAALLLG